MRRRRRHLGKTGDSRTRKAKITERNSDHEIIEHLKRQPSGDFASYLIGRNYSKNTTLRYIRDSERFLQWLKKEYMEPENVRYADVLNFLQSLHNVKQKTVYCFVIAIKWYFNYLVSIGRIESNPTQHLEIRGIKRKILYDILSRQELDALYHNYKIPQEDDPNKNHNWFITSLLSAKRNKVIVGLLVNQGLTTHELSQLVIQDVKLREGKIYIAGSRKSEERELKLEAHQILDLMEYTHEIRTAILQNTKKQNDQLFTCAGSSDEFNLVKKMPKKLSAINPKVTSLNQIRASVITHWLKLYNLRQVQYLAGHRYVSSTEGYLVNDVEELHEEINKYHPLS